MLTLKEIIFGILIIKETIVFFKPTVIRKARKVESQINNVIF